MNHLFLEYELAVWSWHHINHWWEIDIIAKLYNDFSILSLFCIVDRGIFSKVWKITVSAILWSIWLARNESIFNGRKIKKNTFEQIIKLRSFKWLEVSGYIHSSFSNAWFLAPKSCIIASDYQFRKGFLEKLFATTKFTCMVDGSFKNAENVVAGI